MAIYYIENENGTFLSEDGKRRFIRLCGREAYDYLRSAEGKKKRFMKTSTQEDGGEEEYVEVPLAYMRKHRKDERREQYVSDCIEGSGVITISLYAMENDDTVDYASGEELISDPASDVESEVFRKMEKETLRKALEMLTEDEMKIIKAMYFSDRPVTEREMAADLGISQGSVHKRKQAIFRKIKNFFEKF